jgi:guanine nucleotide-binding protein G(o) subunit alpha
MTFVFQADARIVLDVIKTGDESEPFTAQLASALKKLWADKAVSQEAYSRRSEFQLNDSAKL